MIPVLIWVLVAVGGLLLVGTAINLAFWSDKKIAVLGARGVGKTHLIQFLQTGTIPKQYKQTSGTTPYKEGEIKLKDLKLQIAEGFDVSGDVSAYAEWKRVLDQAEIVLYLMRADLILAGNKATIERTESDIQHITEWLDLKNKKEKNVTLFYILGTHCDKDSNFSKLTLSNIADYEDKFKQIPSVKKLILQAGGYANVKIILGSMETQDKTEALVYSLLQQQSIDEKRV